MTDDAIEDEDIGPAEMDALMAQAFAVPTVAETRIVSAPEPAPAGVEPAEKKPATTTIMVVPDAGALAKQETVTRCDACGYTVEPDDGHICDRGGGRLVQCHPFACAVKDCRVARRGTLLPSLSHHAQHLEWHLNVWEKERQAAGAVALAVRASAGPPVVPTADRWAEGFAEATAGDGGAADLEAPAPGAVCVALLFSAADMTHLVGECWRVGQAPLSAYVSTATPLLAVVPIDGMKPGAAGLVFVANHGPTDINVRIGARWELRGDG